MRGGEMRDEPYPKRPEWPLPGIPDWNEFQRMYSGLQLNDRLIVIYQQVIATAIIEQLKEKRE